jgi:putative heme-binding domain-containing protein
LAAFAEPAMRIAQATTADLETRSLAIRVVAQLRAEGASAVLAKLSRDEPPLAEATVPGLVELAAWDELRQLLAGSAEPADRQREILRRMMQSTSGALAVLRMIERRELTLPHAQMAIREAATHPDANIRLLFERFLPVDQRPKPLGAEVSAAEILALAGDPDRGRDIFLRSSAAQCNKCHAVAGQGGTLGPDLSQIGKKYARDALLETILSPSKAIAPEYVSYLVETRSGQLYAGYVLERGDKVLVLRDAQDKRIRIPSDEVQAVEAQQKSLMPELVLRDVSAQDAADLLAYLVSLR